MSKRARQQRRTSGSNTTTISVLPMELQPGDRFNEGGYEWEIVTRPSTTHGGKSLRARVRRPGVPETETEMTWPAYTKVEIRRAD